MKTHVMSLGLLGGIYGALLVLLGLTVLAARADLGAGNLLISLVIAAAKAALVVVYFMHVRYASRVTWFFVAAGLMWLTIMFGLTFAEYVGRAQLTRTTSIAPVSMQNPQR